MALHQNKLIIIRILFQKATDEELSALKEGLVETLKMEAEHRDQIKEVLMKVCEERGI